VKNIAADTVVVVAAKESTSRQRKHRQQEIEIEGQIPEDAHRAVPCLISARNLLHLPKFSEAVP
jgi:hypothetical protein